MRNRRHSSETISERVQLRSLDVDAIFEQLRATTPYFQIVKYVADDIMTQCPFHSNGQEHKPSFGIGHNLNSPSYGLYHCFTCGARGTIIQLTNKLFGNLDEYDTTFVQQVSDIAYTEYRKPITLELRDFREHKPAVPEIQLRSYRDVHSDYLTNRHIDPLIQQLFDCGYDPVEEAVTFPVKDMEGKVCFVASRKIKYKQYRYPAGVEKPIYGLYELFSIFPDTEKLIIVESIINALTLWSWGIPAVALLGTGSQSQVDFLNSTFIKHYILCLDGDDAGKRGTKKLSTKLTGFVQTIPMFDGKDVNDLDETVFRGLMLLTHTVECDEEERGDDDELQDI